MLNITFRNLDSSLTIQALADELLAKLGRVHGEPARAHLVLTDTHGSHVHCDHRFDAHLEISMPRAAMSFQSQSAHADATVAVREAFERVERQIVSASGRREDQTRSHRA